MRIDLIHTCGETLLNLVTDTLTDKTKELHETHNLSDNEFLTIVLSLIANFCAKEICFLSMTVTDTKENRDKVEKEFLEKIILGIKKILKNNKLFQESVPETIQ